MSKQIQYWAALTYTQCCIDLTKSCHMVCNNGADIIYSYFTVFYAKTTRYKVKILTDKD